MTVINGIEIDCINYKKNDIKYSIQNNEPIEEKLNVIVVISNPCLYATRYKLFNEFVRRIEEEEENINLFIVEMIYGNQKYIITDKKNKNHLQLHCETPIWHKENMVNLGVKYLLPKNYKAFAWIDADVEFENNSWALDTLKILNGSKDIVQLFSHCVDMDKDETNLNIFNSFGYSFSKNKKYTTKGLDYWHPGFAWAITRKAYEKIGGLYDKGILGSGDNIIALSIINKVNDFLNIDYHEDYKNSILEYQKKIKSLRLGYVPGVIRHHYHGSKKNRQYMQRWQILINHQFSPMNHITYDSSGILIPTNDFSREFKDDIMTYFRERKEDEN
uniref:Glycosyltransferase 2-like domain-containing protein n=1 Tax=viral metagenome TaxID=1070528 RepID=A0A6C0KXT4_9ZZZZ